MMADCRRWLSDMNCSLTNDHRRTGRGRSRGPPSTPRQCTDTRTRRSCAGTPRVPRTADAYSNAPRAQEPMPGGKSDHADGRQKHHACVAEIVCAARWFFRQPHGLRRIGVHRRPQRDLLSGERSDWRGTQQRQPRHREWLQGGLERAGDHGDRDRCSRPIAGWRAARSMSREEMARLGAVVYICGRWTRETCIGYGRPTLFQ